MNSDIFNAENYYPIFWRNLLKNKRTCHSRESLSSASWRIGDGNPVFLLKMRKCDVINDQYEFIK